MSEAELSNRKLCAAIVALCTSVALLWFPSRSLAASSNSVCGLSDDELASRFFRAVGLNPPEHAVTRSMVRWNKKELAVGVYQDTSAAKPKDPLNRNLALFKALAALGLTLHLGVDFDHPSSDIEVIYVSSAMKLTVLQARPIGTIRSERALNCPVYLDLYDGRKNIRSIARAHILVDDDIDVDDLPACFKTGLLNAVGLIGWDADLSANLEAYPAYEQFDFFISVLYDAREDADVESLKRRIAELKSQQCHQGG